MQYIWRRERVAIKQKEKQTNVVLMHHRLVKVVGFPAFSKSYNLLDHDDATQSIIIVTLAATVCAASTALPHQSVGCEGSQAPSSWWTQLGLHTAHTIDS